MHTFSFRGHCQRAFYEVVLNYTKLCLTPTVYETCSCYRSSPKPGIVCLSSHVNNSSEEVEVSHCGFNLHFVNE